MDQQNSYEDVMSQQRKEKKDIMAETQRLKHSIPKGDKQRKKEMTAEIAQMLQDLELKHERELQQFEPGNSKLLESEVSENHSAEESSSVDPIDSSSVNSGCDSEAANAPQKVSKAQKKRNKKAENAKEREQLILVQEVENLSGLRHLEMIEIRKKLSARNLAIHEVPSDGNCLYKAIVHQLATLKLQETNVASLREEISKHMLSHKEDYIYFLSHPDTGELLSEEQFAKYCEDVASTPVWGGHVEIQALSRVCGRPIEVVQGEGQSVISGEEFSMPKLIISYHRHTYSLGEQRCSPWRRLMDFSEE